MRRLWKTQGIVAAATGAAALLLSAAPASAGITLDTSLIPKATGNLPRLKLSVPKTCTGGLVDKIVGNLGGLKLEGLAQSKLVTDLKIQVQGDVLAAIDGDHAVALVDKATCDIDIMPTLTKLKPLVPVVAGQIAPVAQPILDLATKAAGGVIADVGLFEQDETKAVLGKVTTLFTGQSKKSEGLVAGAVGALTNGGPILLTIPVQRLVGDLPVFGVGSRGLVHVGADGKLLGLLKHWKPAAKLDVVTETRTQDQIAAAIKAQLDALGKTGEVTVLEVKLGLFDSHKGFLQPAYRFTAKVVHNLPAGKVNKVDPDYLTSYVPIGKVLEPIPSLLDKIDTLPTLAPGDSMNPLSSLEPQGLAQLASAPPSQASDPLMLAANDVNPMLSDASSQGPDPTVGRYVVRSDDRFLDSATKFWQGLQDSGYGGYFSNSQYYWAIPAQYSSNKNARVNSVNITDTEGHGDWWLFSTYSNCCDLVNINGDIPYPGYGPAAGGSLAYWIIHSCEVVPSAADTASWPNPWWTVFGGLHTVLGYRTIMDIYDGSLYPFAVNIGRVYPVVNSFLSAVASSWAFHNGGYVQHGVWKPYNLPSTISQCGRENDNVYNSANYGRAGCLQNYWYN